MVSMHSDGRPTFPIEVALGNHPPGIQKKDDLPVPLIREINPEILQLLFCQDVPRGAAGELAYNLGFALLTEEPKTRHGRVVYRKIILRHLELGCLDLRH